MSAATWRSQRTTGAKPYSEPAVLYSFIVGFLVYMLLAKAGLEPKVVAMPKAKAA